MTTEQRQNVRAEMLSPERERALITALQATGCQKSRAALLEAYRPLAANRAYRVACQFDVEMYEDLRSEAMLALIDVLDHRFDASLNTKLGTFARHHIDAALKQYVRDNLGPTRVGTNSKDKKVFHGYRRARAEWERENGRDLDDDGRAAIAEQMDVNVSVVQRMEPRVIRQDVSVEGMQETNGQQRPAWLRTPSALMAGGPDPESATAETVDGNRIKAVLGQALAELSPLELEILQDRHMTSDQVTPLHAIGARHGSTRKRIRAVEIRALNKVRSALETAGYDAMAIFG